MRPDAFAASLPIDAALPELAAALGARPAAVLQAPPGAGKTTRVPLALLDEPWLAGRKIVMLEPRRLAARAAAQRMAATLGERVGETVGFRVHLETRVGPRTRIEVVTEGVLTRMLQSDPALEEIGLVVFDEYHERSLAADVGLALTLQSQELLRPDLRVLVMSATLDGEAVAALLDGAPIVTSVGRSFPVETRWIATPRDTRLESAVVAAIGRALGETEGDVLAFLPGAGEIRRVQESLEGRELPAGCYVAPLFGMLAQDEQDAAIAPSRPGRRKIVLATSIAETSLTIEGVRVVVDSGWSRTPRFSPRTGMTRLETVRVSRASADQRRGRAGRTAPGVCYRLWDEHEEAHLVARSRPEILEADLAPLALDLAVAGVRDPSELRWLDAPPDAAFAQARELLAELEVLDGAGRVAEHGRRVAALGVHPRLAHMVLRGAERAGARTACELAALVSERDVLRGEGRAPDADVELRLEALHGRPTAGAIVDRDAVRRVRSEADRLFERVRGARDGAGALSAGALLALAYPDRVGQRREGQRGRFVLRNGRGAALPHDQALTAAEYIVAAELDDQRGESRILVAGALTLEELEQELGEQITREREVRWDDTTQAVVAREREMLGAIVLRERQLRDADPELVARALAEAVLAAPESRLPWTESARSIQRRVAFAHTVDPSFPDLSDAALVARAGEWLVPRLVGARRLADVHRIDLAAVLLDELTWQQRGALDSLAPTHVTVPSGSRIPIDYSDASAPVLAVRLQEMFGLADTPRVGGGRVPLTLHLLSPAHRPMQVTRDLAGFWKTTYFDVRKDLRGRYPKHHWPEDPLAAEPTARAKRK